METRTFNEMITKAIAKGATKVEVERSKGYCGCTKPGDIIAITVYNDKLIKDGDINYACCRASLCKVFDEQPIIRTEIIWRNIKTNHAVGYGASKEYAYAI